MPSAGGIGTVVAVVFGAIGGVSGIITLLQLPLRNRGLNADTEKTKIEGSVLLTGQAMEMLTAANSRAKNAEDAVGRLEHRLDAYEALIRMHQRWDDAAVRELRRLGADLPDPPPLMPPDA